MWLYGRLVWFSFNACHTHIEFSLWKFQTETLQGNIEKCSIRMKGWNLHWIGWNERSTSDSYFPICNFDVLQNGTLVGTKICLKLRIHIPEPWSYFNISSFLFWDRWLTSEFWSDVLRSCLAKIELHQFQFVLINYMRYKKSRCPPGPTSSWRSPVRYQNWFNSMFWTLLQINSIQYSIHKHVLDWLCDTTLRFSCSALHNVLFVQ